jgi:hypothetical protein
MNCSAELTSTVTTDDVTGGALDQW